MSRGDASAELGLLEWFEIGEHDRVDRVLARLRELEIERLRTGVSCAVWKSPGGAAWYDWLLPRLASELEVLPYAMPSRSGYAGFVEELLARHGGHFGAIEVSSGSDWRSAARRAKRRGWRIVLGGIGPSDSSLPVPRREMLECVDVVGLHGLPGTWGSDADGWLARSSDVWITNAGFSTSGHDELGQLRAFLDALAAPVGRVYWRAAEDRARDPAASNGSGGHEWDDWFGLFRADGRPKLLARLLADGGVPAVRDVVRVATRPRRPAAAPVAVVTGGAGFVGTNVASRLAEQGRRVRILDTLARPGVERNLRWLHERHGERVEVELADVRDRLAVRRALDGAGEVFHLAAQVAVTTSLEDPGEDFDVNLRGTLNVLEEIRRLPVPPPLVFTSTNKVYGALPDLPLARAGDRWEPVDRTVREQGLSERRPLDFCTPYGCSKGGADQYVLDYAKSYGLPAVVFRMSCIYGPHQHGTEDQGWVAHFLLRALAGEPITIYGDGAQVRDILFVDDLVDALLLARDRAADLAGRAFNIGGGPENAVSLVEVVDLVADAVGTRPRLTFAPERPGDQRYYVADIGRFAAEAGWQPLVGVEEGITALSQWLSGAAVQTPGLARAVPVR